MDNERIKELSNRPFASIFPKAIKDIEQHKCPTCGKKIKMDEFRDNQSKKEYNISGMFQACQDEVFKWDQCTSTCVRSVAYI